MFAFNKSTFFTHRLLHLVLALSLTIMALGLQPPGPARAASFTAGTYAELVTAINIANGNGAADDITLTADITLTGALPDITSEITINGAGFMLDGNNSFQVLRVTGGPVILNNITIANGIAADSGGGIEIDGGTLTLNNSTVSNNTATNYGGGLIVEGGSSLTINTSTISGNTANSGAGGGIADGVGTNTININNSTISGNTAPAGTGGGLDLFSSGTTTTIMNTIVANSITTALDCYRGSGTLTSGGYNLVEAPDATCSFAATGDITGSDPGLLALADNGGPTWTHAFDTASPAHNKIPNGTNGCGTTYTTDQRGQPRPFEGSCDIGAYKGALAGTTVLNGFDLAVNKTAVSAIVPFSPYTATITYTISVNNINVTPATGVVISDTLPVSVTFVSSSTTNGSAYNDTTGVWSVGSVGANTGVTMTLVVTANLVPEQTITNTAELNASTPTDTNTGNNSSSVGVTVYIYRFPIIFKNATP